MYLYFNNLRNLFCNVKSALVVLMSRILRAKEGRFEKDKAQAVKGIFDAPPYCVAV